MTITPCHRGAAAVVPPLNSPAGMLIIAPAGIFLGAEINMPRKRTGKAKAFARNMTAEQIAAWKRADNPVAWMGRESFLAKLKTTYPADEQVQEFLSKVTN